MNELKEMVIINNGPQMGRFHQFTIVAFGGNLTPLSEDCLSHLFLRFLFYTFMSSSGLRGFSRSVTII